MYSEPDLHLGYTNMYFDILQTTQPKARGLRVELLEIQNYLYRTTCYLWQEQPSQERGEARVLSPGEGGTSPGM